jgi:hypothetical protein
MRSQVKMAAEIACSRGSLQNSLDRLCAAGWLQRRRRDVAVEEAGLHPSRSYAYRVLLDRDDLADDELEIEPDEPDDPNAVPNRNGVAEGVSGGCQPVGTGANQLARGANPGLARGANPCVGTNNDPLERPPNERDKRSDARPTAFTVESKALAEAFWRALGFESAIAVPPEFAGIDYRAVMWAQAGWTVDLIDAEARRIAQQKPLKPIPYFEKVFATAFARRRAPLPIAEIRQPEKIQVSQNVRPTPGSGVIQAADRLLDKIRSFDARPGGDHGLRGGAGAATARLLSQS